MRRYTDAGGLHSQGVQIIVPIRRGLPMATGEFLPGNSEMAIEVVKSLLYFHC
jgi:hypothetical protein